MLLKDNRVLFYGDLTAIFSTLNDHIKAAFVGSHIFLLVYRHADWMVKFTVISSSWKLHHQFQTAKFLAQNLNKVWFELQRKVNAKCYVVLFLFFKGVRKYVNKDELKPTVQALEKTQTLCSENKGSSELIADINTLFQCIR